MALLLGAPLAGLGACNGVTGANDLAVYGNGGASGSHASGSGSGGAAGSGCAPFFEPGDGGVCVGSDPGDPATHLQADVCARWLTGHVVADPSPLHADGKKCSAGTLSAAGIADTLLRINTFRWLAGLGPVVDDPRLDEASQQCAAMEAFWPFMGGSPHMPPPSTPCYTALAAMTAGQSNLAWGSGGPAKAIDQLMQDDGNATTMGHRRWLLNPPLDPVGIGYWQTGGQYGNAECLRIFGASGTGPQPPWTAFPPPGFSPLTVALWTWTFHGSLGGIASATITMKSLPGGAPLKVAVQTLGQGYAQDAISWLPMGWTPAAGATYEVTVGGLAGGDVTYQVKPFSCM